MERWTIVAALLALYALDTLRRWRNNYLRARATGLPCVLVPALPMSLVLRIAWPALHPLLQRLPSAWTAAWMGHLEVLAQWHDGYEVYRQLGADAYVLVAPGGLVVVTCAPDAIDAIAHRRDHFPRPVEFFAAIGRYGDNLANSEGAQWRRMRRLVARAFGDRNNREVWRETLYQAPRMVASWDPTCEIPLNADTMRMSQNVISKAGFGYRMPWEDDPVADARPEAKHGGMSYIEASRGLVHNILLVIGLPQNLLRFAPSSRFRQVYRYDVAFRAHLRDTIQRGRAQTGGDDILHALLQGAEEDSETLSDSDILGNAFLFMVGGHETTATSMQLAVVYLALNVHAQRQMQLDIDRIVGDRPCDAWTYDTDLPALLDGWVGAVMQEELRLVPPVPAVLKRTVGDQTVAFDGVPTTLPDGTFVALSQLGAHRNPKLWPHGPPTDPKQPWHPRSNQDNDLEEFRPERWFARSADDKPDPALTGSGDFFRPQRGAYFPFSEGARACVGRRFAQIEYAAVLAVIFRTYSVEFDVRAWASDAQLNKMPRAEQQELWHRAATQTRETIRKDMGLLITMHLQQATHFPIRLVPRGQERFAS